jgi:two-component system chemotaxis response regulator CheB
MQFLTPAEILMKPVVNGPIKYFKTHFDLLHPSVIVIGASTGGPPALEKILQVFKGQTLRCPILIAQHMPPVFTMALADRIRQQTGVPTSEGKHMENLVNQIYIAPGDHHMTLRRIGTDVKIYLDQGPLRNSVLPAVDPLFETAAQIYGAKTMGFVLTGMGHDGWVGSRAIKNAQGGIMIQSKESCVVFGMPGAIFDDGCFDQIGDLNQIQETLGMMAISREFK